MKWMPKVFYGVFVLLITVMLYNNSIKLQYQKFYEFEASDAIENNNYDKYFETFFTATKMTDKYSTTPLYEGDVNNLFNLKIMQSTTSDIVVNWFYLTDYIDDYSIFLDEDDHELLDQNFTRLMYTIKVYMDGDTNPITNYFFINPLAKDIRQPLPLMQFHVDELSELTYYYASNGEDNKTTYKQSKTISSVEIYFTLDSANIEKPIEKKLIEINHDENSTNKNVDNLLLIDEVYLSTNFNGNISTHDIRESFKNDDDFIKTIDFSLVNKYNYIQRNYMIKVFIGIIIITYLIFFLAPSINFIKDKVQENKKKKKDLLDNNNNIE